MPASDPDTSALVPSAREDHYLPAALIGGFGRPHPSRRLRDALVAVRRRASPDKVMESAARAVATRLGAYRIQDPPSGIGHDEIDTLWSYERDLPRAVRTLAFNRLDDNAWQSLVGHVACLAARHPDFLVAAADHLARRGETDLLVDRLQVERVRTITGAYRLLAKGLFGTVHRPPDGGRFMINDKGYTTILDTAQGRRGIVFPLSGDVALLFVVDVDPAAEEAFPGMPCTTLEFTPGAVELLNRASWMQQGITAVFAHPDDSETLRALDGESDLVLPVLGPFRRWGTGGIFDWAYEG